MQTEFFFADPNIPAQYRQGFIEVYKEAFSLHPYYEVYKDSEVLGEAWEPHVIDGAIMLACKAKHVVGLGCIMPLLKSPKDVQDYLRAKQVSKDLPTELSEFRELEFVDTWYISELGVRAAYQNQGIGTQITLKCLARMLEHQCHYFVTRTAKIDSNSIKIFKKVGGIELPEPQDVSRSDQVQKQGSKSTERVYLYGRCEQKDHGHPL